MDLDRVQVFAVEELDALDRSVGRLEELLNDPGAVRTEIERWQRLAQLVVRVDASHERAGSTDVRLHDERVAKLARRIGDLRNVGDDARRGSADAELGEQRELPRFRRLQRERLGAIHHGYAASFEERHEVTRGADARRVPAQVRRRRNLVHRERPVGRASRRIEDEVVREDAHDVGAFVL